MVSSRAARSTLLSTLSAPNRVPYRNEIDLSWMACCLVSAVGVVLFVYGKKQERVPQLVAGLLFMVYPYFVESRLWLVVAGLVLAAGLWQAIRLGW